VLELLVDAGQPPFAPLRAWKAEGTARLRDVIEHAVDGYLAFLDTNPAFARLIEWEALTGAASLPTDIPDQGPISTALRAVHSEHTGSGDAAFDVPAVVVAIVSLCYLPIAHATTFRAGGSIDTTTPAFRANYRAAVTDAIIGMLHARGTD
jgi:hypothetical protein